MSLQADSVTCLPIPSSSSLPFSRLQPSLSPASSELSSESANAASSEASSPQDEQVTSLRVAYAFGHNVHLSYIPQSSSSITTSSAPDDSPSSSSNSKSTTDVTYRLHSYFEEGEYISSLLFFSPSMLLIGSSEGQFLILEIGARNRVAVSFSQRFHSGPVLGMRVPRNFDGCAPSPATFGVVVVIYSGVLVGVNISEWVSLRLKWRKNPRSRQRQQQQQHGGRRRTKGSQQHDNDDDFGSAKEEFLVVGVRRWFVRSATSGVRKKVCDVMALGSSRTTTATRVRGGGGGGVFWGSVVDHYSSPLFVLSHGGASSSSSADGEFEAEEGSRKSASPHRRGRGSGSSSGGESLPVEELISHLVICGADPCLGVVNLDDAEEASDDSIGALIRGAGASAGKIARQVTSYVFSWFAKKLSSGESDADASSSTSSGSLATSQQKQQHQQGRGPDDDDQPDSTTTRESDSLIPSRPIVPGSTLSDPPREMVRMVAHPGGRVVLVSDSLGRVFVVDSEMIVMRILKGYRDAQCGWLRVGEEEGGKGKGKRAAAHHSSSGSVSCECFFVYATRRGLVELWNLREGKKLDVIRVGKGGKIVSSETQHTHLLILPGGETLSLKYAPPVTPFGRLFDGDLASKRTSPRDEQILESLQKSPSEFECRRAVSNYETFFYVGLSLDVVLVNIEISPDKHIELTEFALSLLRTGREQQTKFMEVENVQLVESYLENRMKLIQVYKLLCNIRKRGEETDQIAVESSSLSAAAAGGGGSQLKPCPLWKDEESIGRKAFQPLFDVVQQRKDESCLLSTDSSSSSSMTLKLFLDYFKEITSRDEFPTDGSGEKWADVGRFLYHHLDSQCDLILACMSQLTMPQNVAVLQAALVHWVLVCDSERLLRVAPHSLRRVTSFCLDRTKQHEAFSRRIVRLCETPSLICNAFVFVVSLLPLVPNVKPRTRTSLEKLVEKLRDVVVLQSLLSNADADRLLWSGGETEEEGADSLYQLFAMEEILSSSGGGDTDDQISPSIYHVLRKFSVGAFSADVLFYHCALLLANRDEHRSTIRRLKQIEDPSVRGACAVELWNSFSEKSLTLVLKSLESSGTILPPGGVVSKEELLALLRFYICVVELLEAVVSSQSEEEEEEEDDDVLPDDDDRSSSSTRSRFWFRVGDETIEQEKAKFARAHLTSRDIAGFRGFLVFLAVMLEIDDVVEELKLESLFQRTLLARLSVPLYGRLPRVKDELTPSRLRFRRRGFIMQHLPEHAHHMLTLCEAFDEIPEDYVHVEMMKYHFLNRRGDYHKGKECLLLIGNSLKAGSALIEVCKVKMKKLIGIVGSDRQRHYILSEMDARLFQWIMGQKGSSQRSGGHSLTESEHEEEESDLMTQLQDLLQSAVNCLSVKKRSLPYKKAEKMLTFMNRLKLNERS